MPWALSPGADANANDDLETPVVLSARVEAVQILLKAVASAVTSRECGGKGAGSGGEEEERAVVEVSDDAGRELECWGLLLEAREAYNAWVDACRAVESGLGGGEEGKGDDAEEAVCNAAEGAMEAFERVFTFDVSIPGISGISGISVVPVDRECMIKEETLMIRALA